MALITSAFIFGLKCICIGIGLTIIRDISKETLKYVGVGSMLCGFFYSLVAQSVQITFLAGFAGAFAATAWIRYFYELHRYDEYLCIIITSVFAICPGVSMARIVHYSVITELEMMLLMMQRVFFMATGLAAGIVVCNFLLDLVFGHNVSNRV